VDGARSDGGGRQSAAFDPPEVDGVLAAGVEEELSFDDDDPLEEETSDTEEDVRLSVR
jgi:hypothetical protein